MPFAAGLYYEERGAGAPLILLHGNGEDHSYFSRQIDWFSRTFRVLALDTRGHGRSPRGEGAFTISRFAGDLRAFVDELGLERAYLLGFSDGGNIALTFALRWPERVCALVLNGANLSPEGVRRSTQRPIELGYRIAARFAERSEKARSHAELLGLMVHEPHIDPEALGRLALPVLVIAGTRDMIREEHTRLIAQSLPRGQLVLLPGNHFIAKRSWRPFNAAVERFFGQMTEGTHDDRKGRLGGSPGVGTPLS